MSHYQNGYCSSTSNMIMKMSMVSELFELDVLSEEEALKACKVIIGQHAMVKGTIEEGTKSFKF